MTVTTDRSVGLTTAIPGYRAGTWTIDPVHSEVGFAARHMMVSKVRGRFTEFEGTLATGDNPLESSVTATIALGSVDTGNAQRDDHLRSNDFFDVPNHPTMTYRSTAIREDGDGYVVDGELTLKGVTREVPLQLTLEGFGPDAYGGYRAGFSATAEINRRDFGVDFNAALEAGGVVVSDKITIHLEIEAVLDAS
jgi:polyisoprenoid-binding protein YceI